MGNTYDFSGWATKNDIKCSDGRTIRKNAFIDDDGKKVPLVWQHRYDDPLNVLGHALLENRPEGVYAYCTFNNTEAGQTSKELVQHGDITALSIYANKLQESKAKDVLHGVIREVSLVLANANPGASIQTVMAHSADLDEDVETDDAVIYTGQPIVIQHSAVSEEDKENEENQNGDEESLKHADMAEKKEGGADVANKNEKTVQDVIDSMSEEQRNVLYALVGQALESDNKEGDKDMKHNVFDNDEETRDDVISHSEIQAAIADAKKCGTMKEAFIEHGIDDIQGPSLAHGDAYGIDKIDMLFPDYQTLNNPPAFIKRDTGWVAGVMSAVHKTPFSRIKSMFANITEDEARAKGYTKGNLKKEEVFSLLKRTTDPTTVYKKQKIDRDDQIDITSFDVVAWLKSEMRMMLDEEIARAILVGDGRLASDDDHIKTDNIRPVWTDAELYTIKALVPGAATDAADVVAKATIKAIIKARKNYKGSGNPVLYTTEDALTDMMLLEDGMGRDLYESVDKLATKLRVSKIVTVPVMENLSRNTSDYGEAADVNLIGLIVNLNDYNIGADKGGAVNMFDDFDIDYNQMKYLIETRCSGALIKPYSAIAVEIRAKQRKLEA